MNDRSNTSQVVNARRIIDGPSDTLRAVSAVKYPWTRQLWSSMLENNWTPEQVSLARDKQQFSMLKSGQKTAIKKALAFLSNLDSIQVDNLASNVSQIITDPNVRECIYRQQYEEVIHVNAYSTLVESLYQDPMEIYGMHAEVPQLGQKNNYIIETSNAVTQQPTPENKVRAVISNIALEGIYFFSGFLVFYAVGRDSSMMQGAVDMIKYIQRDEMTHLALFVKVYQELKRERPELWTAETVRGYKQILKDACEKEITWGEFVIEEGVPGITKKTLTEFIQYLTELRAQSLGLGGLFEKVRNPFSWFDQYSAVNGSHKNFFESKPQTYSESRPAFASRRRSYDQGAIVQSTL